MGKEAKLFSLVGWKNIQACELGRHIPIFKPNLVDIILVLKKIKYWCISDSFTTFSASFPSCIVVIGIVNTLSVQFCDILNN